MAPPTEQATAGSAGGSPEVARTLVWHGAALIFLGLLSGFTALFAVAPRAALSAHTIGVLQGAVLFAVAGAWHLLRASPRVLKTIKYTLLIGFYANWLGAQLAGIWGAARNMFIPQHAAAMPETAPPALDVTVAVLFNLSAIVLVAAALLLWAARRPR